MKSESIAEVKFMAVKIKKNESELLEDLERSHADEIEDAEIVRGATAKPVAFRASAPLVALLDQLAKEEHRTRANLISHALWEYVRSKKPAR
jgi:hypothetical protein